MPFTKGNKLGGRNKGSLNKTTLVKEERRAIFEQEVSEKWIETIGKLPATYVADQFMGKAPDIVTLDPKLLEIYELNRDILRKKDDGKD